jgi:hypothetical protein
LTCALIYNEIRFDNFFETGHSWQLWGGHESIWQKKFHFLVSDRAIPNIWYYYLAPIAFHSTIPFLVIPTFFPPNSWMSPEMLAAYGDYLYPTSGLFVVVPVTVLALLSPFLLSKRFRRDFPTRFSYIMLFLMMSGALSAVLILAPAGMRYGAEWCMWWIMGGILMAFGIRKSLRTLKWRVASVLFDSGLMLSMIWSCWVGVSYLIPLRLGLPV